MSTKSVMLSNHFILCHPLLLPALEKKKNYLTYILLKKKKKKEEEETAIKWSFKNYQLNMHSADWFAGHQNLTIRNAV